MRAPPIGQSVGKEEVPGRSKVLLRPHIALFIFVTSSISTLLSQISDSQLPCTLSLLPHLLCFPLSLRRRFPVCLLVQLAVLAIHSALAAASM
jgi:hypothetical protein